MPRLIGEPALLYTTLTVNVRTFWVFYIMPARSIRFRVELCIAASTTQGTTSASVEF